MYSSDLRQFMQTRTALKTGLLRFLRFFRLLRRTGAVLHLADKAATTQLLHIVEPGHTLFKIGPHEVSTLYLLSQKVGDTGRVIAFERQAGTITCLNEFRQSMRWTNVVIDPACFSQHLQEKDYQTHGKKSIRGARVIPFDTRPRKEEATRLTTIDEYCITRDIYPDVLQVDAGGAEFKVLLGAMELLKTRKPRILVTCKAYEGGRENINAFIRYLLALGYKGNFAFGQELLPIEQFDFDVHQDPAAGYYGSCFQFE